MGEKACLYTVGELIEELKKFPLDYKVVTSGYENAYTRILEPKMIKLVKVENARWYDGQFQEEDDIKDYSVFGFEKPVITEKIFNAVVLEREYRD